MPRHTHVTDTHRHSREDVRAQRERMISKRLRRSKREIHPDPVIVNTDKPRAAALVAELDSTPEMHDRSGPVVAVHPDTVRRAHPESAPWLLWPFHWARGRFASHPFDRAHSGHMPDGETTRPGWRSRTKRQWKAQVEQDVFGAA
jgi:hypothetical protein